MSFKVGDRVCVVKTPCLNNKRHIAVVGRECVVIEIGALFVSGRGKENCLIRVDIINPDAGVGMLFEAQHLRKLPPDSTFEPAIAEDWDSTGWKPPVREKVGV